MRTTIDIDAPVLKELKRLQKAEGKSLGKLASELLARALAERRRPKALAEFRWIARPMGAKVDLADKEALYRALDEAR
jgi:hypothetical protein